MVENSDFNPNRAISMYSKSANQHKKHIYPSKSVISKTLINKILNNLDFEVNDQYNNKTQNTPKCINRNSNMSYEFIISSPVDKDISSR